MECRHDVITLKTTSIRRRNSVVEMTSIILVDATSKIRRNSVVEMTSIFLVDVTLKLSHSLDVYTTNKSRPISTLIQRHGLTLDQRHIYDVGSMSQL